MTVGWLLYLDYSEQENLPHNGPTSQIEWNKNHLMDSQDGMPAHTVKYLIKGSLLVTLLLITEWVKIINNIKV